MSGSIRIVARRHRLGTQDLANLQSAIPNWHPPLTWQHLQGRETAFSRGRSERQDRRIVRTDEWLFTAISNF